MPSTIPYDPSLALGNLVSPAKLDVLTQISGLQAPADAAEDELNSLLTLRRSLDMTMQELMDMDIDCTDLVNERAEVNKQLVEAAKAYAKTKLDAEKAIQPLKAQIRTVSDNLESPIDYTRSDIKSMPLSADSLKMNVQYFAYDENVQSAGAHAAAITSFVSDETKFLGDTIRGQVSQAVSNQTNSQHSQHDIAGTLVVSVVCTHKNALLLAPFSLDVDKAIRVWNRLYTDQLIDPTNPTNIAKIAAQADTLDEKSLTLLSGAIYGSCFVGMVHVLNTSDTQSSEAMYSLASKMQSQFQIGRWFADESGGLGVENSFANDTKNLLSAQNISTHCSLVTIGSIPSIKSNQVQMAVKGFVDDDGAKSMSALQKLQNATASAQESVDASAAAARTGSQFVTLQNSKITAALSALADIDSQQNKIIDTNSMIDALDDYVQKCLAGNVGVPTAYYLKPVTRSQLAEMWVAKYYPGRFSPLAGEDQQPTK